MSRTFSLCVYAPIQADLFGINLQKPLKSAWSFADWDDLFLHFSDEDVIEADQLMPSSGRIYMRNLRAAGKQTRGWHFAENPRTRYLTMCLPQWTNDVPRLILGLNILRQVLPTSGDGDCGYILAHRFDGADSRTFGAILMRHGRSQMVQPGNAVIDKVIAHATPLASRVQSMAKLPRSHIVDDLEAISNEHQNA